ncbi:unnamed protein product [Caenorhabditis bovis]|uniref:SXP/RAL-2 family protein Ani s 5-like cation-binding domain-containing protein n=1 Tax=Caenorhabditis bovis TaxID=2654633 RepID=A0A8S1EPF2_9PELO|nr:unnamed protein product [Caenorhabditis bovis]
MKLFMFLAAVVCSIQAIDRDLFPAARETSSLAPAEIRAKLKAWKKTQPVGVVSELKKQKHQLIEDHKKLISKVYETIQQLPTAFEKVMAAMNRKHLSPRSALHEAYAYLQKIDKNVAISLLNVFDVLGCPLPADKKP